MNKNLRKRKIKILMKIANNNSGEDLIFAMRSVSKETGTPMLVLKELYEDYPEEMEKVLFPEVPKYEKITATKSGMHREREISVKVKTIGGVHIVTDKEGLGSSELKDCSLGGWPFTPLSDYDSPSEQDYMVQEPEPENFGDQKEYEAGLRRYNWRKKHFPELISGNRPHHKYLIKLKNYEKSFHPPVPPGFDIVNRRLPGWKRGEERTIPLLWGIPSRGASYLIPIGCGYYFIPIITKTGTPIIVKISGGPSENTFVEDSENSTGIGNHLIVGSRKDLNPYFKKMISGIYGCNIRKKKKINKKEEIGKLKERILTTYDNEPKPEDDPRAEESPHGDQGFGKIEYFAYKGVSPVSYRQFSYDPKSHSAIIHRSVLQKIKQKDPTLHAKLMNQKMSNQNENSPTEDYLTKKEIDEISAKYSGGGLLKSPNINLDYDIGDEVTPDSKHIGKSLHPSLETRNKTAPVYE